MCHGHNMICSSLSFLDSCIVTKIKTAGREETFTNDTEDVLSRACEYRGQVVTAG